MNALNETNNYLFSIGFRIFAKLISSCGKLYVFGGFDSMQERNLNNTIKSVEMYDLQTDSWEEITTIPSVKKISSQCNTIVISVSAV